MTATTLFFTGTGTEVGKTYVAAMAARELRAAGKRVGVYKPVASGCRRDGSRLVCDDAISLWEAAGCPGELDDVAPQRFHAPLAPPAAARVEGKRVDEALLHRGLDAWRAHSEIVIVEGAGGLMSPLSEHHYNATLAGAWGCPLLVVAANTLGVINFALQTLVTASSFADGLQVAGVVLNNTHPLDLTSDPSRATNRLELTRRCQVPLLGEIPCGGALEPPADWFSLAETAARVRWTW